MPYDGLSAPVAPAELWYTRCNVPTPLSIAALRGELETEFAPDRIAIRSLAESADRAQRASHYDHRQADSFRQGGSIPAIWARARGGRTRVVGISWTDEYQAIVALPGSGIRGVKDLRGRRIGLPAHGTGIDHNRASALRAFVVGLQTEGLGLDDVQAVDLRDDALPAPGLPAGGWQPARRHTYRSEAYALARGEVDAVYLKDVRGAEVAYLLGAQDVLSLGDHPDPFLRISNCTPRPLTVSSDTLDRHPELVARFLARAVQAGRWAADHPEETVALVSRETGWSEAWVRRAYGPALHRQLSIDLAPDKVRGLEVLKDFLLQWGFIDTDFDVGAWVDPRALQWPGLETA